MPVSKKRKKAKGKKPQSSRGGGPPGYHPGMIDDDFDLTHALLSTMPVEALPTLGMATWHLASTPNRMANQCLPACATLMLAIRSLGIEANMIGLMLDIPWGRGGQGVRYGNEHPHMEGDLLVGHVGLIAGTRFLDPTASQFPEIRNNGGFRPISANLGARTAQVLADGTQAGIGLEGGKMVIYHLLPLGSADEVAMHLMERERDKVVANVQNLQVLFGAALAGLGETRVQEILAGPHPGLAALVARSVNKTVTMGDDGLAVLVDQ